MILSLSSIEEREREREFKKTERRNLVMLSLSSIEERERESLREQREGIL